jgi:hypothetical protein
MEKINANNLKGFVSLLGHGIRGVQTQHYIVMNKLGPNLKLMIRKNNQCRFSVKTIV